MAFGIPRHRANADWNRTMFGRGFRPDSDEVARDLVPALLGNYEKNAGYSINPGRRADLENDAIELLDLFSLQGLGVGADAEAFDNLGAQNKMAKLSNYLGKNVAQAGSVFNNRRGMLDLAGKALARIRGFSEEDRAAKLTGFGFGTDERDQLNQAYSLILGNLAPELRGQMQKVLENEWMNWKSVSQGDQYADETGTFLGYLQNRGVFGF